LRCIDETELMPGGADRFCHGAELMLGGAELFLSAVDEVLFVNE